MSTDDADDGEKQNVVPISPFARTRQFLRKLPADEEKWTAENYKGFIQHLAEENESNVVKKDLIERLAIDYENALEEGARVRKYLATDHDGIGFVLKSHLIVEKYLQDFLANVVGVPNVAEARLTFAQKVALLDTSLRPVGILKDGLKSLNKIRNSLGHDITVTLYDFPKETEKIHSAVERWFKSYSKIFPGNELREAMLKEFDKSGVRAEDYDTKEPVAVVTMLVVAVADSLAARYWKD